MCRPLDVPLTDSAAQAETTGQQRFRYSFLSDAADRPAITSANSLRCTRPYSPAQADRAASPAALSTPE